MARLIDDLLEVSRITSGRIHLHIEPADINAVVELAVERTRPLIAQRKQQLSISLPDAAVWLDADSARLEQVVGNLLHNASKYSDVGGRIWLSVEPDGDYVVIRVKDDGIGMPEHLLPRIFDVFTQADRSLDRSGGGVGVGLALVKSLVEMHHGTVEAHSEGIGRGSEFVVRLPITLEQVGQQESASSQPAKTATDSRRVLVVDDSVDAAKTLAMLLRSWGHEVRIAHNGPDALQRAVGFQPHLILLDIGLPDMDGYEVARLIRRTTFSRACSSWPSRDMAKTATDNDPRTRVSTCTCSSQWNTPIYESCSTIPGTETRQSASCRSCERSRRLSRGPLFLQGW